MRINTATDDPDLLRAEIRRLHAVIAASEPTLTDAERKAVGWFSRFATPQNGPVIGRHAAALRGLLERLSRPDKSYPKRCVL